MSQSEEEETAGTLQGIVELSQEISNVCAGHTMYTVQGALGHLLAQIIMRGNDNDLAQVDVSVDALARAMKADARLLAEHIQRQ